VKGEVMNKVLRSMLKGAVKNPAVFAAVLSFIGESLGEKIKQDGITDAEAVLIAGVRGVHGVAHEFLVAVGEDPQ
jgi:hypothetical protein